MRIVEEILQQFRDRVPWEEIKKNFRSQSQIYDALRIYMEESDGLLEGKREEIRKALEDLKKAEDQVPTARRLAEEQSSRAEKLTRTNEILDGEIAEKRARLDRLNAGVAELQSKGMTLETLAKIRGIETSSGVELLARVKTAVLHENLREEVSELEEKKLRLELETKAIAEKRERAKAELVSERNALDEMRVTASTYKEAVDVTHSFLADGFSAEELLGLKHGVDTLGIKNDKRLSLVRVLEAIQKLQSLTALDEEIAGKRTELVTVCKDLSEKESELETSRDVTLKSLEEVRSSSCKSVSEVAEHARADLDILEKEYDEHLSRSFEKLDGHILQATQRLTTASDEYSRVQVEASRVREYILPGQALLGVLNSYEYLKRLPVSLVVQVVERLQTYCEANFKDSFVQPSADISARVCNLPPFQTYRLSTLLELVAYGLKQITSQKDTKNGLGG